MFAISFSIFLSLSHALCTSPFKGTFMSLKVCTINMTKSVQVRDTVTQVLLLKLLRQSSSVIYLIVLVGI
jgi:hypothetical protein